MNPSTPTAPQFPRFQPAFDARSPSRSPRRKAHFAIKELDPLLGNLSPDSTLRALQATATISNGAAQEDALTSSIADATPAEREVGIRAAFAAQKVREWKEELSKWRWPSTQERGFGIGFIPPQDARDKAAEYRGCLPVWVADEYEARVEEIRDDFDSLRIDEIKDHVLEAHLPTTSSRQAAARTSSYGRMRDFTALVTATVIQSLPDLAKLNSLLDTWDIRLRILRELPRFLEVVRLTQSEIQQAFQGIRHPTSAQGLTELELDNKKLALGGQVSDMGRRIDRLLDMLEGQQDSLPQAWIDRLEKIELDYATWVVEAQHVALKNQLDSTSNRRVEPEKAIEGSERVSWHMASTVPRPEPQPGDPRSPTATDALTPESRFGVPADPQESKVKRKPSLKLNLSDPKGHKREASKVSVADSMYSTFSDISNAEIMDAKTTSLLPSPKVSVVDNPFRASRDELTWFGSSTAAQQHMASKPPMIQRASTASIEVYPKDKLKQVSLRRAASWDMISQMALSPDSTPSKALKQLGGDLIAPGLESFSAGLSAQAFSTDTTPLATPSLQVEPLRTRSSHGQNLPSLPRRSSKRNTIIGLSPIMSVGSAEAENAVEEPSTTEVKENARKHNKAESLDHKIQDILTTLPTKIRLAKDADSASSTSRTSTSTPSLTLSPAKTDPANRRGSFADPYIKLYHLTRTGQSRETPPTKLFVRTVGDGGRVMVRVGGGWADLGEYLKEYSLHHGSRATADGQLEVASFPDKKGSWTTVNGVAVRKGRRKSKSPTVAQTGFESTDIAEPKAKSPTVAQTTFESTDLVDSKASPTLRPRSPERVNSKDEGAWTPPPVPQLPSSYTIRSPATTTSTAGNRVNADAGNPETPSQTRYSIVNSSGGVKTTTVVTPPTVSTSYTPLGAAGPKTNVRRAATYGAGPAPSNDAWVQGMVGKARAVSGTPATMQGPNTSITTTTTTVTTPPSSSRRVSSYFGSSPNTNTSPVTIASSPSTGSVASDTKVSRRASYTPGIRKGSRMSLSDIGGIRRVFLRKKSEAVTK